MAESLRVASLRRSRAVLQNLRFFAPRDDFLSGFAVKLIQLIDAGPGSSDYGNDDGPPRRADVITVTARNLLDDSVGSPRTMISSPWKLPK
jgi:hypothetical protein